MSDLLQTDERQVALVDPRTGTTRGRWSHGAPVIDLVGDRATLDLTDSRPRPGASVLVQHAHAVARPDDLAVGTLVDRWLTPREAEVAATKGERARAGHVLGRVAAKQAIQAHLAARGFAPVEPHRIEITNDPNGRPAVGVRGARVAARNLVVSIAHGRGAAVAVAGTATAANRGVGIDIEAVEPRSSRFERLTLAASEQALTPLPGDDRDTWLTRLWSAKEAAAKATGLGLQGRPKDFVVRRVLGTRLQIADRWIATEQVTFAGTPHIVATIEDHRTECAWHRS